MKHKKPIELDGRTGEGGGQLVRISVALAAVTSQPIRITHIRGNRSGRSGGRGGGLKSQHVTSIKWLTEATGAEVEGLFVDSHTLEFRPSLTPPQAQVSAKQKGKPITIAAGSPAASTLLIFQAVLPYLLFAAKSDGGETTVPVELEIRGGTNVSFSLSYEYLDQVLLPTLEARFAGVHVERRLQQRSWSTGSTRMGSVWFRIHPLPLGQALKLKGEGEKIDNGAPATTAASNDTSIRRIDASILAPTALHAPLQDALAQDLDTLFPDAEINFKLVEESGHDARMYVLLVAHNTDAENGPTPSSRRWGRDYMYDRKRKNKSPAALSSEISRRVSKDLYKEVAMRRGAVDEYLQDQLIVFQALAEGQTSFPRGDEDKEEEPAEDGEDAVGGLDTALRDLRLEKRMRNDKTAEPFGDGSMHTKTARWVASEILPGVKWFNRGSVCEGAGISFH
ncbi:RNA 3'-terminal phosphate cyclase-like protein [Apiospora kogelbergensis]|uniref:RNA 3'-terminal phosphate cyclase-like protein n=1 Tax=Apiospora kogelbergensis TaxID=1337665 RepID=A0AAW0RCP5_9PEZI